jgi:hypothetical protein
LRLTWIGASDGIEFVEVMRRLVDDLKALGPREGALARVG